MTNELNGVARLTHLGVIRVLGEDARQFLQGQLTQDFALLGADLARLAAFCTAKGRMQASFVGFRGAENEVLLVCSRDILEPTLKRLSMFVMRAKAKLSDATGDFALYGAIGKSAAALMDGSALAPWTSLAMGGGWLVSLYPAMGQPRAICVLPAEQSQPAGPVLSEGNWLWSEVHSGIATITQPIVDAFVPQMLNYESVGGVNFKKGCYPGQEVVARSQFRGTLKRRAFLARSLVPLLAGQEVFHESDETQPCGLVAQAAQGPGGEWDAIVSLQISAAAGGRLTVGAADGAALELQPLPYLLVADV